MLENGKWIENWHPYQASDGAGRFVRQTSSLRNWVTADGSAGPTGVGGFPAEPGRYVLYVALICPWASRTLMARALKGLERTIDVVVVSPVLTPQGWCITEGDDPTYMHQLYTAAVPTFTGRATVPVLWDRKRKTIVNNESADIVRMLNQAFFAFARHSLDLYPEELSDAIDVLNADLYDSLNNGVYKAGFAQSQEAYDEAVAGVFGALDRMEERLRGTGPYLFGDRITESDIRLFVTLVRFDAAYYGLFKCNLRRLADYPMLSNYIETILGNPGVAATVNLKHIKAGYYSVRALNPAGIVPQGPELPWDPQRQQRQPMSMNQALGASEQFAFAEDAPRLEQAL